LQYDILPVGAVRYPNTGRDGPAVATAHASAGVLGLGSARWWDWSRIVARDDQRAATGGTPGSSMRRPPGSNQVTRVRLVRVHVGGLLATTAARRW